MDLLSTIYLPAGSVQASTRRLKLETPWPPYIVAMPPVRWSASSKHGGYCPLELGSMTFNLAMFNDDWPPPFNFAADLEVTETTEAAKSMLFEGVAHQGEWDQDANVNAADYDLYGPDDYTTQLAAATTQATFGATLDAVFTWACNAARLNLTLDTTLSRAVSPAVVHTTSSDQLLIDFLDDLARYHTHLFYIEAGTLYLVDMEADNGTDTAGNERTNMQEPSYHGPDPLKEITDGSNPPKFCSYPYGDTLTQNSYETNTTNIAAAQAKIKTILDKQQITCRRALSGATMPKPGKKFTFTRSLGMTNPVSVTMWAREIEIDFIAGTFIVTGEGTVTAI